MVCDYNYTMRGWGNLSSKYILLGACIVYLVWNYYVKFQKPLKNIGDYRERALAYKTTFLVPDRKKKSISILKEALELEGLNNMEKSILNGDIGQIYFESKDYDNSVKHFDEVIEVILDKDIYYSRIVNDIIKAYYYSGNKDRAKELYENFLQRQEYDSKFAKVKNLSNLFE